MGVQSGIGELSQHVDFGSVPISFVAPIAKNFDGWTRALFWLNNNFGLFWWVLNYIVFNFVKSLFSVANFGF